MPHSKWLTISSSCVECFWEFIDVVHCCYVSLFCHRIFLSMKYFVDTHNINDTFRMSHTRLPHILCLKLLLSDMSNFRQLADFRLFCLVLGHSCESSRSGLIFTSVWGGRVSLGPICIVYFLLNTK